MTGGLMAPLLGQSGGLFGGGAEEEAFRASTKQVNQFFRRFNGEEDGDGNKYLPDDKRYRDYKVRREYLPYLIDGSVTSGNPSGASDFISQVNDRKSPIFLEFHGEGWFAEVNCIFKERGQDVGISLIMKLQHQGQGYEWVIEHVSNPKYLDLFGKDTTSSKPFIHPMSHELDFMNLRKAFQSDINPESFTLDSYKPDFLTIFLYQLKKGELTFSTVQSVRFHFFSIPGWYFEIDEFNRPGMSSGWLISNLVAVTDEQKQQLKSYIYGQ